MEHILSGLNDAQRLAVSHTDGPLMVLAGAGSGKTRVLTYKVAYLIAKGIDPFHIIALTFTNKAAHEMKERILHLVGTNDARNVWMGTFHSVFAKILRMEGERIGYPNNFTIYDTDDSKSVLKGIVKELNYDEKAYAPGYLLNRISSAKMNLVNPREYMDDPEIQLQDKAMNKPKTGEIYQHYWNRCRRSAAMDFDDLLYNTNLLFRDFPEVLHKYQNRFQYILVDEYQDTNYAQYLILKRLAALRENICVVGDDAQSIYAFRGANIENIFNFRKDYPDHAVYKLEQNYRSTSNIVSAANSIIEHNKNQIHKKVWTENEIGESIGLMRASSDNEEAQMIASMIFHTRMTYQLNHADFAILYRTNAQSRPLEEALRKLNIPYKVYGGMSFYKRKEVKDMLAYLRIVVNPADEEALFRIINTPVRGIGKTTTDKIRLLASDNGIPAWEMLDQAIGYPNEFNSGIRNKLSEFATLIKTFRIIAEEKDAYEAVKHISTGSGMLKMLYEDKTPEGISRYENIEALINGVKAFCDDFRIDNPGENPTLADFMLEVSLLTDLDENEDEENTDRVSLMTIHAAKGLEFPYVFISGVEENLFPNIMAQTSRAELEEERRLFYVAITRAMKKLTLSYAETRFKWGELNFCEPSRFIQEIDESLIDSPKKSVFNNQQPLTLRKREEKSGKNPTFAKKQKPAANNLQIKTFAQDEVAGIDEICIGQEVEHTRFGAGKVLAIEGTGQNKKASVYFAQFGEKQLLLKFARLKIIR